MKKSKKYSILLCEDDVALRGMMKILLESLDIFEYIIEAGDGVELGFKMSNQVFDVVVLDQNMPKKNGIDALSYYKEKNYNLKKFILCTGEMNEILLKKSISLGCTNLLSKPFDAERFLATVKEVLENTESHMNEKANKIVA